MKAIEMCLVPNIMVPKKFKVLEFAKYTSTQYPMTHLKVYCNKMTEVIRDKKLLIHFFLGKPMWYCSKLVYAIG